MNANDRSKGNGNGAGKANGTQATWLVAHDFSPCGDAAAFEAARLLEPTGGTVKLLHVHEPVAIRPERAWGEETFALERSVRERLAVVAAALRARNPRVNVDVAVLAAADPVRAILDEAERDGVGQIIVGTHGRTGLSHLVLGSVAERVVREAKVPVLVVKAAAEEAGIAVA